MLYCSCRILGEPGKSVFDVVRNSGHKNWKNQKKDITYAKSVSEGWENAFTLHHVCMNRLVVA